MGVKKGGLSYKRIKKERMVEMKRIISTVMAAVLTIMCMGTMAASAKTIAAEAEVLSSATYDEAHSPAMAADGDRDTYLGIPKEKTGWQLMALKLDSKYPVKKVTILTNGTAGDADQHNLATIMVANGGDANAAWDETAVRATARTAEATSDGRLLLTYDFSTTTEEYSYVGLEMNNFGGGAVDTFKIYEINVYKKLDTIAGKAEVLSGATYDVEYSPANVTDGEKDTYLNIPKEKTGWQLMALKFDSKYPVRKVTILTNGTASDANQHNLASIWLANAGGANAAWDESRVQSATRTAETTADGKLLLTYYFAETSETYSYVGLELNNFGGAEVDNFKIYEIEVYEPVAPITEGNLAYGKAPEHLVNITDGYLDTYTQFTGTGWQYITLNLGELKNIDRVVVTSNIPQEGWNAWYNLNKCAISETEAIDFSGAASVVKSFETPVYNADTGLYTYTYSFRGLTSAAHQYIGFEGYNAWDPAQAGNLKIYEIEVYEAPDTIAGKAQVMSQKGAADYLGHAPAMVADGDEDTYMGIPKALTGWQLMALKLDSKYLIEKVTILTNGTAADANQQNLTSIALANGGDATAAWDGTAVKSTGRTAETTADGKLLLTYDFSTTSEAYSYVGLELNNWGGGEVDTFKIYEINVILQPEKDGTDLALVRNGAVLKARYWENTYLENNNPNVPKHLFDNDVTTGYTPLNQTWDNVSVQLAEESAVSYIKYITDSPISIIANGFDMQPYVSNELSETNEITYGDGYVRLARAVSETQLADGKYEIIYRMPDGYENSTWKYAGFVAHDITDKSAPLTSPVIYQMSVYAEQPGFIVGTPTYENGTASVKLTNKAYANTAQMVLAIKDKDGKLKKVAIGDLETIALLAEGTVSATIDTANMADTDTLECYLWYSLASLKPICAPLSIE